MAYINFTDINNNILIDRLNRPFLVKDSMKRVRRKLSHDEMQDLANDDSIKYSFYLYALYDDDGYTKNYDDVSCVRNIR